MTAMGRSAAPHEVCDNCGLPIPMESVVASVRGHESGLVLTGVRNDSESAGAGGEPER